MEILDFILHIDEYMARAIELFGGWTYVLLFAIIFAETGLVFTPFLPGDSLLFAVGTLAGSGFLNVWTAYIVMLAAAILGDTVNYWIGYLLGPRVFVKENSRFFNRAYLAKTHDFYERHGGKTIILARFLPIIRTFAPFVAGIGKMNYRTFLWYNVFGGFVWITSLVFAGYFLGRFSFVKESFEFVIIGIIVLSLLPSLFEYIRHRRDSKKKKTEKTHVSYEEISSIFDDEHKNE